MHKNTDKSKLIFKKTFQKKRKGFTLIELLLVIAIISILASSVLSAISFARAKGVDVTIKSNLKNIVSNAEIQLDNVGCYAAAGPCGPSTPALVETNITEGDAAICPTTGDSIFATPSIMTQIANAEEKGVMVYCSSTAGGAAWAVIAQLTADPVSGWCIDSSGFSGLHDLEDSTPEEMWDELTEGVCTN